MIERLFQKFEDFYGAKWANQYALFPRERVKATWGDALGSFSGEIIGKALEAQLNGNFPPTLPEFRTLCREALRREGPPDLPRLGYKPDPEKQAEFSRRLGELCNNGHRGSDPVFWATHPKSHIAMRYILGAAKNDPARFQPCIDSLIAEGKLSEDGRLLKKYAGLSSWIKA